MIASGILARVGAYYADKIARYGPVPKGVDWNSGESQRLRFGQLLQVAAGSERFSINDFGCGYGALLDYLEEAGLTFSYTGLDIVESMLEAARALHGQGPERRFVAQETLLAPADFTVASGIFNVKTSTADGEWLEYVLATLERIDQVSIRGFAFNCLTSHCDVERKRDDLYYADPAVLFDYCARRFSRRVTLLHDYPLFEFTILVRKEGPMP